MNPPSMASVVLICTLLTSSGCAGPSTEEGVPTANPIMIGSRHAFHSDLLDEDRELRVYLPKDYESSEAKRYPLMVVLDARPNFKATAAMVEALAEGGAIPRMIVVGITNTDRWRDLTPVAGMGIPGTGGGDRFLACLPRRSCLTSTGNGVRAVSGSSPATPSAG